MYKELIESALHARTRAYSPYSKFKVGAALMTADGKIYEGCNIENSTHTPTCCAERTAFFKAVSEGEKNFIAIAIVGGFENETELDFCAPCGVCRQVMQEFCDYNNFKIILAKNANDYNVYTLAELLPMAFAREFK